LFVGKCVYKLPPDGEHDDSRYIMCTLVDSDQSRADVPENLVLHGMCLFIMYVSSPAMERWLKINKTTQRVVVIMNPWGRREIQ
jgi:hypothetical protein